MSKLLAVFGATGTQGGSVITHVSDNPSLSQQYKIRAITRDTGSEQAKKLSSKVEVVAGDVSDRTSLEKALTGVDTVFAMTTPAFGPDAVEIEFNNAKTIADVAVSKGVKFIIFSTLPSPSDISGGKYTAVTPFEAKAKAEKYIRGLPIKSAFFAGAFFMENFATQPFLNPQPAADGTWVMYRPVSPKMKLPYIDATSDAGKFVGPILETPEKYEGKVFCAAAKEYSSEEIVAIMSEATGKKIVYKQVPLEDFKNMMPVMADSFAQGFSCQEEYGYFGSDGEEKMSWARDQVKGRLVTLEEYFEKHPPQI